MTRAEKRQAFWERNRKSGGYLLKKKIGQWLFSLGRGILIFGLCFLILQPLLQKLCVSFMSEMDLYDNTITSVPRHFSTISYSNAWRQFKGITTFLRSLWLAVRVAFLQVLSCTLVGYGFARFKFPFKKFLFGCVILMLIVPPTTIITPLYLYFGNFDIFGIIGSITGTHKGLNLQGLAVPYLLMCATCAGYKAGLYIYMMRQHFRNEPKELEEAAYVDGCGRLRTFFQILLPGARPMMVSVFLFAFVWQWTDQIYTRVSFPTAKWDLVSTKLLNIGNLFDGENKARFGMGYVTPAAYMNQVMATGTLMALVPLLVIYVVAQRSFVESISQSGIKG